MFRELQARAEDVDHLTELPTGTLTMLFTDIESSTQLLRKLGEEHYQVMLAEHRRLLRDAWRAQDGYEVDSEGDSFFVVFRRAKDAVTAAVQAQRALATHSWPGAVEVRVRMGMHTGEPNVNDEGYVGLDVHRGARIAAAAHGGQVLLSETTRSVLAGREPKEVTLRDLGQHRLKDFVEPQRLYQLVIEGAPSEFPLLRTLKIPAPPTVARPARSQRAVLIAAPIVLLVAVLGVIALVVNGGKTGSTATTTSAPNTAGPAVPLAERPRTIAMIDRADFSGTGVRGTSRTLSQHPGSDSPEPPLAIRGAAGTFNACGRSMIDVGSSAYEWIFYTESDGDPDKAVDKDPWFATTAAAFANDDATTVMKFIAERCGKAATGESWRYGADGVRFALERRGARLLMVSAAGARTTANLFETIVRNCVRRL